MCELYVGTYSIFIKKEQGCKLTMNQFCTYFSYYIAEIYRMYPKLYIQNVYS